MFEDLSASAIAGDSATFNGGLGLPLLSLLFAFRDLKELVVKARSCAEGIAEPDGSAIVAVDWEGGCEEDCGGDDSLTLPRDVSMESSKSCFVVCLRPALLSSGDSIRSCCS